MAKARGTETKQNACLHHRPRPTELRWLFNPYQPISSSFLRLPQYPRDRLCSWVGLAHLAHPTDTAEDMVDPGQGLPWAWHLCHRHLLVSQLAHQVVRPQTSTAARQASHHRLMDHLQVSDRRVMRRLGKV
jgi:hypothetical protein